MSSTFYQLNYRPKKIKTFFNENQYRTNHSFTSNNFFIIWGFSRSEGKTDNYFKTNKQSFEKKKQKKRDLNPCPSVLETAALPTELFSFQQDRNF
jgi:hypothetical protein